MTLQQIIRLLEIDGENTKKQVRDMLKNANNVELKELKDSIDLKLEYDCELSRKIIK